MSDDPAKESAEKALAFSAAMFRDLILKGRAFSIDDTQVLNVILKCCEKQMKGYEDETAELMLKCNKKYEEYRAQQ